MQFTSVYCVRECTKNLKAELATAQNYYISYVCCFLCCSISCGETNVAVYIEQWQTILEYLWCIR